METPLESDAMLRERPTSVRYLVLVWLCVAAAIAYLQRNCIGVAESTIRSDLGLTKDQMGWLLSGFFWTYALFQIPSGWLGDRLGSRLTLPLYSGIWSVATLVTALAGTVLTVWLAEAFGFAGATVADRQEAAGREGLVVSCPFHRSCRIPDRNPWDLLMIRRRGRVSRPSLRCRNRLQGDF